MRKDGDEIFISVLLQDAIGNDVGSAEIEGPAKEIEELYKVIPESLMLALHVDVSTLKKIKNHSQSTNSTIAYAHFLQARREARARNFENAEKQLQRAIVIGSSFAMAYWALGEIKLLEGDPQGAEQWHKRADEIDPDHPELAIVTSQELHLVPMFSAETQIDEAPMSGIRYTRLYYAKFGIFVHAWAFDNDLFNMRSELAPNNKLEGQTASEFLTKPNDVLSINGGYFEIERNAEARNTLTPSGLIIADGREFSSINPKDGSVVLFTDKFKHRNCQR